MQRQNSIPAPVSSKNNPTNNPINSPVNSPVNSSINNSIPQPSQIAQPAPVASSSSAPAVPQQQIEPQEQQANVPRVVKKAAQPKSVFSEIKSVGDKNLDRWRIRHAKSKSLPGKLKTIFNGGRNFPAAVQFDQDDQLGRNLSVALLGEHLKKYAEQPDSIQLARAVALVEEVRDFHQDGVNKQRREKVFPDIQSRKALHSLAIDSYLSSMHEENSRDVLEASASGQHSGLYHRGLGITATVLKPGVSAAGVAGGTAGVVAALGINAGLTVGGAVANLGLAAGMRRFTKGKESLTPLLVPVPSQFSKGAPDVKTSAGLAKGFGKQSLDVAKRLSTAIEDVKLKEMDRKEGYEDAVAELKTALGDAEETIKTQNKIKTGMQNAATEFNGNRENIIAGVAASVGLTVGASVVAATHGGAAPAIHLIADAVSGATAAVIYAGYQFGGGPQREGKKKFNDILINNLKSPDMLATNSPMSRTQIAESYRQYLHAHKAASEQDRLSGVPGDAAKKKVDDDFRETLQNVFDHDKVKNFSAKPVTQRIELAKKLLQGKLALELEKALPYTKVGEKNTVPDEIKEATGQLLADLANMTEAEKCIRDAAQAIPAFDTSSPKITPDQNAALNNALGRSEKMLTSLGDEQVKLLFTGKLRDQLKVQFASTELMMLEAERYEWTVHGGGAIAEITKDTLVAADIGAAGFASAHESVPADISGDVLNTTNKLVDNSIKPSAGEAGAIRNTLQRSDIVRDIREKSMSGEFRLITQTEMQVPLAKEKLDEEPYAAGHFNVEKLFDGEARVPSNGVDPQNPADFYIPTALRVPGAGKVALGDTTAYFDQVGKSPADKESEANKVLREAELTSLLKKAYWKPAVDTLVSLPKRAGIKSEMKEGRDARREIEQNVVEAKWLIERHAAG